MTFLMVQLLRIESARQELHQLYCLHALEVKFSCKDYNLGFQIGLGIAGSLVSLMWTCGPLILRCAFLSATTSVQR